MLALRRERPIQRPGPGLGSGGGEDRGGRSGPRRWRVCRGPPALRSPTRLVGLTSGRGRGGDTDPSAWRGPPASAGAALAASSPPTCWEERPLGKSLCFTPARLVAVFLVRPASFFSTPIKYIFFLQEHLHQNPET